MVIVRRTLDIAAITAMVLCMILLLKPLDARAAGEDEAARMPPGMNQQFDPGQAGAQGNQFANRRFPRPEESPAQKAIKWLHVVAASIWVGGHAFLLFVFPRLLLAGDNLGRRYLGAYRSFSSLIIPVFLVLIASGAAGLIFRSRGPRGGYGMFGEGIAGFFQSFAGQKISLTILAAIAGLAASLILVPRLSKLMAKTEAADGGDTGGAHVVSAVRMSSVVNLTIGVLAIWVASGR